jgi:inhibitor of cysteine peptidase
VSGWVPDGCTRLAEIRQEREGNTVTVTMTTQRPSEMMCTQAIVEFEERVKLEGGFEPGEYVVRVNDFEVTFGVD